MIIRVIYWKLLLRTLELCKRNLLWLDVCCEGDKKITARNLDAPLRLRRHFDSTCFRGKGKSQLAIGYLYPFR